MDRRLIWLVLAGMTGCKGDGGTSPVAGDDDDTKTGCARVTSVETASGALLLHRQLKVALDRDADVWVVCTLQGDPEEEHLWETANPGPEHNMALHGLAAGSTYDCTATPSCEGATPAEFQVETDLPSLDGWDIHRDPTAEMSGAYTLFNDQDSCADGSSRLYIVDPEGRLRWSYVVGNNLVLDLDASYIGNDTIHVGGGWGLFDESAQQRGIFRQVSFSGGVVLERSEPDFGLGFNHHSEILESGEALSLTASADTDGQINWHGVGIELYDPATEAVTWSWSSQQLHDDGTLDTPDSNSPYHANSVTFLDDELGQAAWVSLYVAQEIWRIDRTTGARTHVFGRGGDFTLVDTDGTPLPLSEWPYAQHDPDYTDDNRLVLFDNGVGRPGGSFSRVAEFELDFEALTATLLWSWTRPNWYDPVVGDADYLPNGNVLVANGYHWCLSFTGDRTSIIELDPRTDTEVWSLTHRDKKHSLFRAERYGGCEMFNNGKYCPEIADRIAELR